MAVAGLLALASAVQFQDPGLVGMKKVLSDFDAFYIAGTMAGEGRAAETYDSASTFAAQHQATGRPRFMPWTYPPPYTLFMAALAHVPIGVAYLLFVGATLTFYVLVLRRIAGAYLPGVLVAMLPTLLLTVRTGQNGFLTAGLIGWFLLAFIDKRAGAGVPLGLMVLKPHLAVGISLLVLLGKRWKAMFIAATIVTAAALAATAAFGMEIWPAFLGGVREAGEFLAAGYYPLFRMPSVYAFVRTIEGPVVVAAALQAASALAALGLIVGLWARRCEPHLLAAATCLLSLCISPYSYDYDMAILGLGVAFVLPELVARAGKWELAGLLLLVWFVTGYGYGLILAFGDRDAGFRTDGLVSLGALAALVLALVTCLILRRSESPETPAKLAT